MRSTGRVNRTKSEKSPWEYKFLKGQTEKEELFLAKNIKREVKDSGVAGGKYPWTQERELFQKENFGGGAGVK